jgi:exosome complex RNA-binding protein Csl4
VINSVCLAVSGQYGCALSSAEPTGLISIPIAEISQDEFEPIRKALLAGDIIEATLTSEGMRI